MRRVAVAAGHGLGREQRVEDRLLGRFDHRVVERGDLGVREHPKLHFPLARGEPPVARGEGEEEVAARMGAGAAHSPPAEASALGETITLMREERSVRRDDADDRTRLVRTLRLRDAVADQLPDGYAVDAEAAPAAVVRLDEHADGVAIGLA